MLVVTGLSERIRMKNIINFLSTILLLLVFTAFQSSKARPETVMIDFESSSNPLAVPGADATNLYEDLGVTFPSGPIIMGGAGNQVLQQGDPPPGRLECSPLVIELDTELGVRRVGMRVINRHLRYYTVQAFSGATQVDEYVFWAPIPPPPPYEFVLYRDITLEAADDEGDITRIVVNPPSDCFDLASIDNLTLETACVCSDPVSFTDPNLAAAVREQLGGGISDLSRLTALNAKSRGIVSLEGLECATNLTHLILKDNNISDLEPIAKLEKLQRLDLSLNDITDVLHLKDLVNLVGLRISHNKISDVEPLASLTNLTDLRMANNQITDVSELEGLTELVTLLIQDNNIDDISVLANYSKLEGLQARNNGFSSIEALRGLNKLRGVFISSNNIVDIGPLSGEPLYGKPDLVSLKLGNNQIVNINALETLTSLEWLELHNNHIVDVSVLGALNNLKLLSLGNNLIDESTLGTDSDGNGVNDILDIPHLEKLYINDAGISNIEFIGSLGYLKDLRAGGNNIDNVSSLESLPLDHVTIHNNLINNIGPLERNTNLTMGDALWVQGNCLDITGGDSAYIASLRRLNDTDLSREEFVYSPQKLATSCP